MFKPDLPSDVPSWQRWLLRVCVALPLLMLAANLVAWWRWGTDLPFLDDWRAYHKGVARSLHLRDLLEPANNTIAPVGLALDALAQRGLGGNPIAYQSLTMLGVLGGLLWLQWRLLGWALGDPVRQACVFVLTVFMLQSGSYWGEQNLAFHQGLPLLFLLGATWLNFAATLRHDPLRLGAMFVLGFLAGLSYVSGAVGALLMGAAWLGLSWHLRPTKDNGTHEAAQQLNQQAHSGGWMLLLAGVLSLGVQLFFTRRPGVDVRGQSMHLTWPHDPDFWAYAMAKWGRATGHGFTSLALELGWVVFLLLGLSAVLFRLVHQLRVSVRPSQSAQIQLAWQRVALVFVPLFVAVLAYLILVTLGRAGLREPDVQTAAQIFRFGYGRFHFFWLTLLFPWLVAVLVLRPGRGLGSAVWVFLPGLALLLGLAAARGVFDVGRHYESASGFRAGELRCLARQLGSGQPIMCPGFEELGMDDWTPAFVHAQDIGASFVRYLPMEGRSGFGQTLLHWHREQLHQAVGWQQAQPLSGLAMLSQGDAQLWISLDQTVRSVRDCRVLGVQLGLQADQAEAAQLFYLPFGESEFTEKHSVRQAYAGNTVDVVALEFSVDSVQGFEPLLRIDPVDAAGRFQIHELSISCRLWGRAAP